LDVTQSVLEAALCEELQEYLKQVTGERPRRFGSFKRVLDSEHGRIEALSVPKLRHSNGQREWQILGRYQRGLAGLLNFCLSLYVIVAPFLRRRRGSIAMDDADIEVILLVKVQNGTLENGIEATVCFIAPKGGIDPGVVNFLFPLYVLFDGQFFPLTA
jgi:Transposase, Mutator family